MVEGKCFPGPQFGIARARLKLHFPTHKNEAAHMREKPTRLKIPSLRRWLLQVHRDLLAIHQYVPSGIYPESLSTFEKMILVLEDRRFFKHAGNDYKSIAREIVKALTFRNHGGASTIDMQLVRTVIRRRERTIRRKMYELMLARIIQFRYSKARILRAYLGCAFFGSKLYGADSVSIKEFGKLSDNLDLDEAAQVASMLVYPRPLEPTAKWRSNVRRRANYGKFIYVRLEKQLNELDIREPDYI